ncbi:fasciclin domain-containing protein [Roseisolibacter agri]|uniref:Fasciclin n=1 Tax=Roseisolibacter agri TaxID=2014610 RepID=A0AA37QG19_9BACT|nr:fasciclin domain-containing protein [Roseisolibacter agri]GLC25118.1 fasciclin [Roseisolibacter agri]
MSRTVRLTAAALVLSAAPLAAQARLTAGASAGTVMVGAQAMYPTRDIVDNAVNSADHTTLVAAVKAAGLVETLKGKGPFTVFAPTNNAFAALPAGTVESLVKPENRATLTGILTYHVAAGSWDAAALERAIRAGGGTATIKTVNGGSLSAMMNGPRNIVVRDAKGGVANIPTYDVRQSNGVIHVVDRVLMPGM